MHSPLAQRRVSTPVFFSARSSRLLRLGHIPEPLTLAPPLSRPLPVPSSTSVWIPAHPRAGVRLHTLGGRILPRSCLTTGSNAILLYFWKTEDRASVSRVALRTSSDKSLKMDLVSPPFGLESPPKTRAIYFRVPPCYSKNTYDTTHHKFREEKQNRAPMIHVYLHVWVG